LFITEHAYFALKYWALSKKIDAMIVKKESADKSEKLTLAILFIIVGIAAASVTTMIYFMDQIPATPTSVLWTFIA